MSGISIDASRIAKGPAQVRVWDPLVRLFHWTVVGGIAANLWFTEEGENTHQIVGYVVLSAIAVRVLWGFVGSYHARFRNFVPGPKRLRDYVSQLLRGREPRYLGHNPAAVLMMAALLATTIGTGVSGWMMTLDAWWGVEWLQDMHEVLANSILVLAGIHVAAAIITSFHHRENLILSMFTGRKRAAIGTDVDHAPAADRGQPEAR
jgi:cytochrome b